ncbi:MAG TPA: hypothetical protein VGN95_23110 [Pyrinomonadaceae bacterium]|jgi:hypothetical protein|nr:hypothetical protein [Pyrinomonadaceae bacterium]
MKYFRQLCAAIALVCILAVPGLAGDISCGMTDTPPPATSLVTEQVETTDGINYEVNDGIAETFLTLLQDMLSSF